MRTRTLGPNGPEVSAVGLGCMGMSAFYGSADDQESLRTITRALELGCNLLDTSDMYGPHTNEELVGRAIGGRPPPGVPAPHRELPHATGEGAGRTRRWLSER